MQDVANRVDDWKSLRVETFGELLRFGSFIVIKGDAGKDSEREVRIFVNVLPFKRFWPWIKHHELSLPLEIRLRIPGDPNLPLRMVIPAGSPAVRMFAHDPWRRWIPNPTSSKADNQAPCGPEDTRFCQSNNQMAMDRYQSLPTMEADITKSAFCSMKATRSFSSVFSSSSRRSSGSTIPRFPQSPTTPHFADSVSFNHNPSQPVSPILSFREVASPGPRTRTSQQGSGSILNDGQHSDKDSKPDK